MEMKRTMEVLRPEYHLQGIAEDSLELQHLLGDTNIDLAISDIELSDVSVFDALDNQPGTVSRIPFIFTTGYDKYRHNAENCNTVAFLLKPVTTSDLLKALCKFEESININSNHK